MYNLNIFVDGSIVKKKDTNETIGCAGALLVINNEEITRQVRVIRNSTNNDTEIRSILLGIETCIQFLRNNNIILNSINLFSDSKICIYGLREWIFDWVNCSKNGILYNSTGNPVANQETFKTIVMLILENNLNINLFHQKGHVSINSEDSLLRAKDVFNISNHSNIEDINFIKYISIYNNEVDKFTKEHLRMLLCNNQLNNTISIINPIILSLRNINIDEYKNRLKGD